MIDVERLDRVRAAETPPVRDLQRVATGEHRRGLNARTGGDGFVGVADGHG